MKNIKNFILICCFIIFSCASVPKGLRTANEVTDVCSVREGREITSDNAGEILKKYSIFFEIPNPFQGDSGGRSKRFDPNHESTIHCRAVLLDNFSTEADIQFHCLADSLDDSQCEEFRKDYIEKNLRDGMFRIRIEMESGFSEKSMNPNHWALYIENSDEVMIEPVDIKTSSVEAVKDSVYSKYNDIYFNRSLLRQDIILYFNNRTFFGQDIFGSKNPFIVLVVSRKKQMLARVAWKISEEISPD